MAKRCYKMQEFVAHASDVNCLKIGSKSCRVLVTGGDDHKVNVWAIGRPNPLLRLSGHTSPVDCVTFDSAEVLVVSGTSSGGIKLWDLELAKTVRTITGHQTNCSAVEFHPFGEFFASGSVDTNLKIWDIRRKGCIHTYKGHTQGISTIKFTPDGRWVVSGGEDNVIKVWDLTAGKLLHDFNFHEGKIQCIEFHPHEFLLATGSADRTVKFWDLETFELIGSTGPEATGVRSLIFHPDGRTIFGGLDGSLKVFSWEPIRCHDALDVGWSTLGDLRIREGKLMGCSYHQSSVAVWAADISHIGPYAAGGMPRSNGHIEPKLNLGEVESVKQTRSSTKSKIALPTSPHEYGTKFTRSLSAKSTESSHGNSRRAGTPYDSKEITLSRTPFSIWRSNSTPRKKPEIGVYAGTTHEAINGITVPVIVPRNSLKVEISSHLDTTSSMIFPKPSQLQNPSDNKINMERQLIKTEYGSQSGKTNHLDTAVNIDLNSRLLSTDEPAKTSEGNDANVSTRSVGQKFEKILAIEAPASVHPENNADLPRSSKGISSVKYVKGGRTRSLVERFERREKRTDDEVLCINESSDKTPGADGLPPMLKGPDQTHGRDISIVKASDDEDIVADLMQNHDSFLSVLHPRLTKLQVVRQFWGRNDVKGSINAVGRLPDRSVQADLVNVLMEKIDIITLDVLSCLLPLLTGLLDSKIDRHVSISLEMLLKLVKVFGPLIGSTIKASSPIGVDLQAEQRRDRCKQCFVQLQKVKQVLPSVIRRGGLLGKSALELNLALQNL